MALRTHFYSRITLTSLALLLGSTAALAGPDDHHRGRPGNLFARLDQNGDGKIERTEARAAASKYFVEADQNGDGSLTRDEQMGGHAQPAHEQRVAGHFARMDANSDGKVDLTETRMPADAFARSDTNHDGTLTKAELEASWKKMSEARRAARFAEFDTNSDGKIAKTEVLARADRHFAELDGNKDGHVTRREARSALSAKRRAHGGPPHDCKDSPAKSGGKGATKSTKGHAI
jgi:Ca2+-binding EF-hand superfamily protein